MSVRRQDSVDLLTAPFDMNWPHDPDAESLAELGSTAAFPAFNQTSWDRTRRVACNGLRILAVTSAARIAASMLVMGVGALQPDASPVGMLLNFGLTAAPACWAVCHLLNRRAVPQVPMSKIWHTCLIATALAPAVPVIAGLVSGQHWLGPMTTGVQAAQTMAIGLLARGLRQVVESSTNWTTMPGFKLSHVDGTALSSQETWVFNVVRGSLYSASSILVLAGLGTVLGTHTTGVLTELSAGLDGPRKVAVQAATTSILGAFNEMVDAWFPDVAKLVMAWKFDGRYVVRDDAGDPVPVPSMPVIRQHALDYTATRMATSTIPELFNVVARMHDRWGLSQGLSSARLAVGDFSLLLGGAIALSMLSPIKVQLFKESEQGTKPDIRGLVGSDGVMTCIAACLDCREGSTPDFAKALDEVRGIEARQPEALQV